MSDKGWHVIQVLGMIGAGVACFFVHEQQLGMALIGAGIGNAGPMNLIPGNFRPPQGPGAP